MGQRDKLNPVIYCIENTVNEKKYIGSATRYKERMRIHRSALRRNVHFSTHLQSAWNKYGEENFKFWIIESVDHENLDDQELLELLTTKEEEWITYYNSTNREVGYNTRSECTTNLGLKWSEESKRKFSEKKKLEGAPIHAIEGSKRAWQTETYRKHHKEKMELARASWTPEKIEEMKNKRSVSMQKHYQEQLEKTGRKIPKEVSEKVIETGLANGTYRSIYCYLPNGKFLYKFRTVSDALRFLNLPSKNSASLKDIVDTYFFKGLIWSFYSYDVYPEDKLSTITCSVSKQSSVVINLQDQNKYFFELKKDMCDLVGFTYKRAPKLQDVPIIHNNYKIIKIAPIIGDDNDGIGEFIESLYRDNNELSVSLND